MTTKDFANKPKRKPNTRKTTSRKPATKTNNRAPNKAKSHGESRLPAVGWFGSGVVVGFFIAYMLQLDPNTKPSQPASNTSAPQATDTSGKVPVEEKSQPKTEYEFYRVLEETEVVVPKDGQQPPAPKDQGVVYYLQAVSLRSAEDANQLRAELMLNGMNAVIESSDGKNGTWHRVVVGPFTSRSKMAKARSELTGKGMRPLLLKRQS